MKASLSVVGAMLPGVSERPTQLDAGRGLLSQQERMAEGKAIEAWLTAVRQRNVGSVSVNLRAGITILETEPTLKAKPFGDPQADWDLDDLFIGMAAPTTVTKFLPPHLKMPEVEIHRLLCGLPSLSEVQEIIQLSSCSEKAGM